MYILYSIGERAFTLKRSIVHSGVAQARSVSFCRGIQFQRYILKRYRYVSYKLAFSAGRSIRLCEKVPNEESGAFVEPYFIDRRYMGNLKEH